MDIIKHAPSNKSGTSSNLKVSEKKIHVNTFTFLKCSFIFVIASMYFCEMQ